MTSSLKTRAISGAKWSSASQVGRQALQVVTTVILALLLAPADFGLLGMATIVTGFVGLFRDLGTSAAVIRQRDPSPRLLSSVFWLNAGFGTLAALAVLLCAGWIAAFFGEPRLVAVLRALAAVPLLSGLGVLQQTLLERTMDFRRLARAELAATALGSAVGIASALMGLGVWSLVHQTLTVAGASTLLLWLASRWTPRFVFDRAEVAAIRSFSLNLVGYNLFNYFARNADNLLIGKFLGAEPLGYYALAYRVMLYPLQSISGVIGRVMFPVYSELQDDDAKFRRAYLKVAGAIALITFPMMTGVFALAAPFVLGVFGESWAPVVPLLLLLAPVGLIQSVATTVGALYQAKGRTDWMFRWGAGAGVLIVLAIAAGLPWGIVGVAAAYAAVSLLLAYPSFAIPFGLISLRFREFAAALARPLAGSALMGLALATGRALLPASLTPVFVLAALIPVGCLVYGAWTLAFNRQPLADLFG